MHSVMKFEGLIETILEAAVRQGLAKTKIEALRLGAIELNNKYGLLSEEQESKEDAAYIRKARGRIAKGKLKLHSEKELEAALRA